MGGPMVEGDKCRAALLRATTGALCRASCVRVWVVSLPAADNDREQGHPGGCTREEKRPQRITGLALRCLSAEPLFAAGPWPRHTGGSWEALVL